MTKKLPPLSQNYFDANRDRFEADSQSLSMKDIREKKCQHFFVRKSATEVECRNCLIGWIDMGRFNIKSGRIAQR